MTMYERIKDLRIKKGLSQQELARLTGYSDRSSIAKIESGCVDLPQSKILLFAKALGITPDRLMGLTEPYPKDLLSDFWNASDEDKIKLYNQEGGTPAMAEEIAKVKGRLGYPVITDPENPPMQLSPHERQVILAYRQHPEAQPFVDKLLEIEAESVPQPKQA